MIIAGFGHFGSTIGRFLRASGINATILDNDSDRVELLRKMGFTVFYGDATRLDILKSAGADNARILIAAIDSPEINFDLIEKTKKELNNIPVLANIDFGHTSPIISFPVGGTCKLEVTKDKQSLQILEH